MKGWRQMLGTKSKSWRSPPNRVSDAYAELTLLHMVRPDIIVVDIGVIGGMNHGHGCAIAIDRQAATEMGNILLHFGKTGEWLKAN